MGRFFVKDVVCDYGIFNDRNDLTHTMILNSNRNALLIAAVMNVDEEHKIFEIEEVERLKQQNKTEFEQYQIRLAVRDKEIEDSKLLNHQFALEIKRLNQKSDDWENKYYDCQESYNSLSGRWAELKQENEGLSESVRLLSDEYTRRLELQEENEKSKEVLRKCNPFKLGKCISCGYLYTDLKIKSNNHKEDCEYVKLCGEGVTDG